MNSKRAWLVYTVIRLLAFAVPFAVVMLALPDWQWTLDGLEMQVRRR
mgnify:CR=1 FL=1